MPANPYPFQLPELDIFLTGNGLMSGLGLRSAEKKLAESTTPQHKAAAQHELEHWQDLAKWRFAKNLPPLGDLYKHDDGRSHLVLSPRLETIRKEMLLRADYDQGAEEVNQAIQMLFRLLPASTRPQAEAMPFLNYLQGKIRPRLLGLVEGDASKRASSAKKLKKDLCKAIDRIVTPDLVAPSDNAKSLKVKDAHGKDVNLPLEVAAIDTARNLAEKHEKCPKKKDVIDEVTTVYDQSFGRSTWSKVWANCELKNLDRRCRW